MGGASSGGGRASLRRWCRSRVSFRSWRCAGRMGVSRRIPWWRMCTRGGFCGCRGRRRLGGRGGVGGGGGEAGSGWKGGAGGAEDRACDGGGGGSGLGGGAGGAGAGIGGTDAEVGCCCTAGTAVPPGHGKGLPCHPRGATQ